MNKRWKTVLAMFEAIAIILTAGLLPASTARAQLDVESGGADDIDVDESTTSPYDIDIKFSPDSLSTGGYSTDEDEVNVSVSITDVSGQEVSLATLNSAAEHYLLSWNVSESDICTFNKDTMKLSLTEKGKNQKANQPFDQQVSISVSLIEIVQDGNNTIRKYLDGDSVYFYFNSSHEYRGVSSHPISEPLFVEDAVAGVSYEFTVRNGLYGDEGLDSTLISLDPSQAVAGEYQNGGASMNLTLDQIGLTITSSKNKVTVKKASNNLNSYIGKTLWISIPQRYNNVSVTDAALLLDIKDSNIPYSYMIKNAKNYPYYFTDGYNLQSAYWEITDKNTNSITVEPVYINKDGSEFQGTYSGDFTYTNATMRFMAVDYDNAAGKHVSKYIDEDDFDDYGTLFTQNNNVISLTQAGENFLANNMENGFFQAEFEMSSNVMPTTKVSVAFRGRLAKSIKPTPEPTPEPTPTPTPEPTPTPTPEPTPTPTPGPSNPDPSPSTDPATPGTGEDTPTQEEPTNVTVTPNEDGTTTYTSPEVVNEDGSKTIKEEIKDASGKTIETKEITTQTDATTGAAIENIVTKHADGSTVKEQTITSSNGATTSSSVITNASGAVTQIVQAEKTESGATTAATFKPTSSGEVTLTDVVASSDGRVVIPESFTAADGNTYTVTKIEAKTFKNDDSADKITIPATVTNIGKGAFRGSDADKIILNVDNANELKIEKNAFRDMKSRTKVIIHADSKEEFDKIVKKIEAAGGTNLRFKYKKNK